MSRTTDVIRVHLEPWEVRVATHIGKARMAEAKGAPVFEYAEGEGVSTHVTGALAECAAAKGLGVYWNMGINTRRLVPDVGCDAHKTSVEVRWSTREVLKVRDVDADDQPVVLVTGSGTDFTLVGWMMARSAKRPEWRQAPRPGPAAFFVPREHLQPMAELEEYLAFESARWR